ncbi:MAG: ATP-binding protein [Bacillota bacterium]|nr:ATP-binding protein [Bacillota bacterium]
MVERMLYLNKLTQAINADFVKLLTGVRRSGKSTLLKLFKQKLLSNGVDASEIIEISFEKYEDERYKDQAVLHERVKRASQKGSNLYLLIDEIQEMEEWAKIINSLHASFNIDIYLTGSNARMFSGEHLTYLAGRYLEIKVYPLSFSEYLDFKGIHKTDFKMTDFDSYISNGSFPAIALNENNELVQTINEGLFDSIFARDIIMRGQIRDPGNFFKVAKFIFENIGSSISAHNIANVLKTEGSSVKSDTVDNYLKLMCDAYLLYHCDRFDIRGKARFRTNGKYYCVDTGIRNQMIGLEQSNRGHILENVVFLELIRRGFSVLTGKNGAMEIDFMVQKGKNRSYIQVAWTIMDDQTRLREQKAFAGLPDAYPRYIISMDEHDLSEQGIKHLNIIDFLLTRVQDLQ